MAAGAFFLMEHAACVWLMQLSALLLAFHCKAKKWQWPRQASPYAGPTTPNKNEPAAVERL
jgi:hypothetical protein